MTAYDEEEEPAPGGLTWCCGAGSSPTPGRTVVRLPDSVWRE